MGSPRYSIIIIGRRVSDCDSALRALSSLEGVDKSSIEIILATGKHPSQQRNAAAEKARGEFLLFLDDDSCADPKLIQAYEAALSQFAGAKVIGGPSICRQADTGFKRAADIVLSSPMGLGPFRARYLPLKSIRLTNERELILCNLLIRRDLFLGNGGFRRDLYPNEENELLTRLLKKTQMVYQPEAICYREPRGNFVSFARQFFWYGHGRAKHYVLLKPAWNVIFVLPMLFTIYNFCLLMRLAWGLALTPILLLAPAVYAVLSLIEAIRHVCRSGRIFQLIALPILFWTCHFFYGLGFIVGILLRPILYMLPEKQSEHEIVVRLMTD
jgi:succinoglycan biosynthesis protein ExoA